MIIRLFLRWLRARDRRIDRETLFPFIAKHAKGDPIAYRNAIRLHIAGKSGRCWRVPRDELTREEKVFMDTIFPQFAKQERDPHGS